MKSKYLSMLIAKFKERFINLQFARQLVFNFFIIIGLILGVEWFQSRNTIENLEKINSRILLTSLEGIQNSKLLADSSETLIYVFAPWCQICKLSSSNLNNLENLIEVRSLALSYDNEEEVRQFKKNSNLEVPILLGENHELGEMMGIQGFPTYLIVDSKGNVLYSWLGYGSKWGIIFKVYMSKILYLW